MRDVDTVGEATISLLTAAVRGPGHDLVSLTLGGWDARRVSAGCAVGLAGEEGFEPSIP
jgi:hypothetical protein